MIRSALVVLTVAGAVTAGVLASGPSFWTVATAADFLKGRSDGVYVSLEGVVTAGPALTNRLTATPGQVWSLAQGTDGTLWAGTGGDGRLLRIRGGQPEQTAFDAEESNLFAVAIAGSRVYAASSPDGRVYLIDGAAAARPFFDPEEKYIWSLAVDGSGRLWVGAGTPAVIYRVEPNGTGKAVYKPPADHVVSLTIDARGRVLAGTDSPGRLYRLDANDRPFAMLDSGLAELRAIATTPDGVTYAAAVAKAEGGSSGSETASIVAATPPPSRAASGSEASSTATRRAVLYRIDPAGVWEAIWESPDVIYDLAALADGGVLVATGPGGRLYKVLPTREVLLFSGVDAKQITRFGARPSGSSVPPFATANPGRVVVPGSGVQSPAIYLSPVRDTKSISTWGLIRWEATGAVTMFTRSGNTDEPDDSWTEWTGPYSRREGELITSPPARFIQWKAELRPGAGTPTTQLTSTTVAYLPRNGRPQVASVTVHPPGVVFQRPFANEEGAIAGLDDRVAEARRPPGDVPPPAPAPGRRMFQKGLQTIAWKAEDPDSDRLVYSLQYRRDDETAWQDLRTGLLDQIFVWDTTSVADGRYVIRVVASDAPANAADRALTGDRPSELIIVDNTPPAITTAIVRQGASARLAVRVQDALSPIQKLEYSVSGGPWQLVYPADGLADSPDERYEIPLTTEADAARIVVRGTDLLQNLTTKPAR
jgi:sugar lactone lactonase YvrE